MIFKVKSIDTVDNAGKQVDGIKRPREPPTGGTNTKKVLRDGYYTKTDVESHITAAKDEISLGVSQVYETKKTVSEKVAAAEKNANAELI